MRPTIPALLLALVLPFPTACTTGEAPAAGPDTATTLPLATSPSRTDPISVVVELPQVGHRDRVDGTVTDLDGNQFATFSLRAGMMFLEPPSASNQFAPRTSTVLGAARTQVQLPGPGTYRFEIGDVGYWGGCGTCGRGFAGGSVEVLVEDGSRLLLDLGQPTWVS